MPFHPAFLLFAILCGTPPVERDAPITTGTLLEEMHDLSALARLPEPAFRTVQFSSYDRRSTGPEDPDWFSNADGFGREPVPGFLAVLEEPGGGVDGLYLVAEVEGPGAIVRGWSAGMAGTWKVFLDGAEEPVFTGSGYDFLARRSQEFLSSAGLEIDAGDAFCQQDADYFPVPFGRSLRVTWRGPLNALHFYHLQVRLYEAGTSVETFDPERDVPRYEGAIRRTVQELLEPRNRIAGEPQSHYEALKPRSSFAWVPEVEGPGAVTEFAVTAFSPEGRLREALRGCLLRISFDGSQRPQVEAPIGDFFGSGPGHNPISSLPVTVSPDRSWHCRFVMPFAEEVRFEVVNTTESKVGVQLAATISPWTWDERSLHFRARWRIDHELVSRNGERVLDYPYLLLRGRGRLVGAATMVVNPAGGPMASGNWWGEGDEKIFVDDEPRPSTFGTGSEDFYNYSWSRPALFDHPYCGQPLDSGPDTAGFVSNHRFFITDSIPFERFAAFLMELWQHTASPGLSYGGLVYAYARPGALDDHRALTGSDLVVSPKPPVEPLAIGGARDCVFHLVEELAHVASGGEVEVRELEIAPRGRALFWIPKKGEKLSFELPVEEGGHEINLVGLHRADGPMLRFSIDGNPLVLRDGSGTAALRAAFAARMLNVRFARVELEAGVRRLELECLEAGTTALDYFWIRRYEPPLEISGAIEAEGLEVSAQTPGIAVEPQRLDAERWSGGTHLWVRAEEIGHFVTLTLPVTEPGRYRLIAHLTKSYDYGIVQASIDGVKAGEPIDTFNAQENGVVPTGRIELGEFELEPPAKVRFEVVGRHPRSSEPGCYFGVDCLVLERLD